MKSEVGSAPHLASFHAGCGHPERGISLLSAMTSYAPCTEIALRLERPTPGVIPCRVLAPGAWNLPA
jgi:hypothetical protein